MKPSPAVVGVVTFTDPRDTGLAVERESYLRQSHQALARLLSRNGAKVVDPMKSLRKGWTESDMFGLRTK